MPIVFDQPLNTTDSPTFDEITTTGTQATLGNFVFNADQTVGAGQDNYVLTYDDGSGEIGLEAAAGGGDLVNDTTPQLGGDLDFNGNGMGHATGASMFYDAVDILNLRRGSNPQEIRLHNLYTDGSTNEEYLSINWNDSSNRIVFDTKTSGGTVRDMRFRRGGTDKISLGSNGAVTLHSNVYPSSTQAHYLGFTSLRWEAIFVGSAVTSSNPVIDATQSNTASSGTIVGMQFVPTHNQTGTAGSTDLLVNRTESGLGSGSHYFCDFQVSGTSKIRIDNTGTIEPDKTTADEGFINFKATADGDSTSAISTLTTSGSTTHHIQIEINGTKAWIAASTNAPT